MHAGVGAYPPLPQRHAHRYRTARHRCAALGGRPLQPSGPRPQPRRRRPGATSTCSSSAGTISFPRWWRWSRATRATSARVLASLAGSAHATRWPATHRRARRSRGSRGRGVHGWWRWRRVTRTSRPARNFPRSAEQAVGDGKPDPVRAPLLQRRRELYNKRVAALPGSADRAHVRLPGRGVLSARSGGERGPARCPDAPMAAAAVRAGRGDRIRGRAHPRLRQPHRRARRCQLGDARPSGCTRKATTSSAASSATSRLSTRTVEGNRSSSASTCERAPRRPRRTVAPGAAREWRAHLPRRSGP